MKIYGPYVRKDGRSHIIYKDKNYTRTQSYPRYIMEEHLGRELDSVEHVDHINNNPSDNRIENLQILSTVENNRKSFLGTSEKALFICPTCKIEFEMLMRRYRDNNVRQGKAGPYCSKSCAGKAHH